MHDPFFFMQVKRIGSTEADVELFSLFFLQILRYCWAYRKKRTQDPHQDQDPEEDPEEDSKEDPEEDPREDPEEDPMEDLEEDSREDSKEDLYHDPLKDCCD